MAAQEAADPKLYAENVRRLMAERLGAQLSSHGLKEQQELKRAGICVDMMGRCGHTRACACTAELRSRACSMRCACIPPAVRCWVLVRSLLATNPPALHAHRRIISQGRRSGGARPPTR